MRLFFSFIAILFNSAACLVYIVYISFNQIGLSEGSTGASPIFPAAFLLGIDITHALFVDWATLGLCIINLWLSTRLIKNKDNLSAFYVLTCSIYISLFSGKLTLLMMFPVIVSSIIIMLHYYWENIGLPASFPAVTKNKLITLRAFKYTSIILFVFGLGLGLKSYIFYNKYYDWREYQNVEAIRMPDDSRTFISFKNTGFAAAGVTIIISTPEEDMELFSCCTENWRKRQIFLDITGLNALSSTITDRLTIPLDYGPMLPVGKKFHLITYNGNAQQFHKDKPKISEILDQFFKKGSIFLRHTDADGGEWGMIQGENM